MLKLFPDFAGGYGDVQPPSGGCVLKHNLTGRKYTLEKTSRLRAAVC